MCNYRSGPYLLWEFLMGFPRAVHQFAETKENYYLKINLNSYRIRQKTVYVQRKFNLHDIEQIIIPLMLFNKLCGPFKDRAVDFQGTKLKKLF